MGLDVFAARTPDGDLTAEDEEAFRRSGVRLSECNAEPSFRGRRYVGPVLDITDEGLNREWIPPETVREMWFALERCDPVTAVEGWSNAVPDDILELRKWFAVCAARDLGIVASW